MIPFLSSLTNFISREEQTSSHESEISLLNGKDRALYNKIVHGLLHVYSERYAHPYAHPSTIAPQTCAIIFRQSKSWRHVQDEFEEISSMDTHIKQWVTDWIKRINLMRTLQAKIHDCVQVMQSKNITIEDLKKTVTNSNGSRIKNKIKEITNKIFDLKKLISKTRTEIKKQLDSGNENIDYLTGDESQLNDHDRVIIQNSSCKKIIQYLKKHQSHLGVFLDWPEISLDLEVITAHVQRLKDQTASPKQAPFSILMNRSTKGVFLISEEETHQSPVNFEHSVPGYIFHPTKIKLETNHFSPESPPQRVEMPPLYTPNPTSSFVHKIKFLDTETSSNKDRMSNIVRLALASLNTSLCDRSHPIKEQSVSSPDPDSRPSNLFTLVSLFPTYHNSDEKSSEPS